MKKTTLLLIALLLSTGICPFAWAQNESSKDKKEEKLDTVHIKLGDFELIIQESKDGDKVIISDGKNSSIVIDDRGISTQSPNGEKVIINDTGIGTSSGDDDTTKTDDGEPNSTGKGRSDGGENRDVVVNKKDTIVVENDSFISIKKKKKGDKLDNIKTRWVLFDVGINGYLQNGGFDLNGDAAALDLNYGKSWYFHIGLFKQRINLVKHHVNLMYGMGFEFWNYHFSNDIKLLPNTSPLQIVLPETIHYKTNKLYASYLTVPLMLNLETKPWSMRKSTRLNVGVYGSLLLGSRTKQVSDELGTVVFADDFNLSKFRYGVIGQLGIGPVNLFATYSLVPLFEKEKAPELHPFNIGLSIIPF